MKPPSVTLIMKMNLKSYVCIKLFGSKKKILNIISFCDLICEIKNWSIQEVKFIGHLSIDDKTISFVVFFFWSRQNYIVLKAIFKQKYVT